MVFEKPGVLSENAIALMSSNYPTVQYFLLKLLTLQKGVWDFFLLCVVDLELLQKLKRPGFYTLVSYTFVNNSRSKQNLKNLARSFFLKKKNITK